MIVVEAHANTEGQKGHFTLPNTRERKRKERKYSKWQYNQVSNVWSPVFTKTMFGMAKLRSATLGVPNMQFSRSFDGLLAYGGDELFAIVLQEAKALPDCVLGQH